MFHKGTVLPKVYMKCVHLIAISKSLGTTKKKFNGIVKLKLEKLKTFVNTLYPDCMLIH